MNLPTDKKKENEYISRREKEKALRTESTLLVGGHRCCILIE